MKTLLILMFILTTTLITTGAIYHINFFLAFGLIFLVLNLISFCLWVFDLTD
jgi:hypothetical protein